MPGKKLAKEVVDKMKNSRYNLRKFSIAILDQENVANEVKLWCSFLEGCPNLEFVR